jgi:predicted nucleotidyltransferase
MAQLDTALEERARAAVVSLSRFAKVTAAYLFGSQVEGRADHWSDIDLAVFIEGVEAWSLPDRARIAAKVQKEAGDDIELHFFPASSLDDPPPGGFAQYILRHGMRIFGQQ